MHSPCVVICMGAMTSETLQTGRPGGQLEDLESWDTRQTGWPRRSLAGYSTDVTYERLCHQWRGGGYTCGLVFIWPGNAPINVCLDGGRAYLGFCRHFFFPGWGFCSENLAPGSGVLYMIIQGTFVAVKQGWLENTGGFAWFCQNISSSEWRFCSQKRLKKQNPCCILLPQGRHWLVHKSSYILLLQHSNMFPSSMFNLSISLYCMISLIPCIHS